MIVSHGRCWPPFVAGAKSVTRRDWKEQTARHFVKGYIFDVYDQSPRQRGRKIGRARVTDGIYREPLADMPTSDYLSEGFAWLNTHPWLLPYGASKETWAQDNCSFDAFNAWRHSGAVVWVVRYQIISIERAAVDRLNKLLAAKPEICNGP